MDIPNINVTSNVTAASPHGTAALMRSEECGCGFENLKSLGHRNLTREDELVWPCELREYWVSILPLVNLAESLLHYGTPVVIGFGLVFNLIIICTLSSKNMRRISTNLYLLALGIYDSCVLIFNFLVGVLRGQYPETVNRVFQEKEWLCLTHSVVVELFNLLSVWMIVCFTIERLIVVYFPLKAARLCSIRRTKLVIVLVSLLLTAACLHKLFVSGFDVDSVFGYEACMTNRIKHSALIYIYVGLNTWLPTLVIITLNLLIAKKLRSSQVARRQFSVSANQNLVKSASQEVRITRTLLAVSVLYVILLLPLGFVQTVELWIQTHTNSPSTNVRRQLLYIESKKQLLLIKWTRAACFAFYQLNYALNLVIYTCSNKKFRFAIIKKFGSIIEQIKHMKHESTLNISSAPKNLPTPQMAISTI